MRSYLTFELVSPWTDNMGIQQEMSACSERLTKCLAGAGEGVRACLLTMDSDASPARIWWQQLAMYCCHGQASHHTAAQAAGCVHWKMLQMIEVGCRCLMGCCWRNRLHTAWAAHFNVVVPRLHLFNLRSSHHNDCCTKGCCCVALQELRRLTWLHAYQPQHQYALFVVACCCRSCSGGCPGWHTSTW